MHIRIKRFLSVLLFHCIVGAVYSQTPLSGESPAKGDVMAEETENGFIKRDIRLSDGKWETPRWSLKTNGLVWLATIPNITGEFRASSHFALDLGIWWCPWKIADRYSLKVLSILPEGRWWFAEDAKGHFVNLHLTAAWFNLRFKENRYQDAGRPLLGVGIGYGYQFSFTENWGLELQIGVGYMNMRYNNYYNISNGALIDTRRTSYWGLDRLGVSLVYCFTP